MKPALIRILILAGIAAALWLAWPRLLSQKATPDAWPGYAEGEMLYIAAPIGGEVATLNVQRGDQVAANAPLFTLDRTEEMAARAEAEETLQEIRTQFDKAKLDFERAKSLRDKKVIAPENYDAAVQTLLATQHGVAARQRALEQADWRHSQKQQEAPVTALVYDTYFRPGEWVPAGQPVVALLPPEYLKVRFFVPESDLGRVQIGTPISISMDGLTTPLAGQVCFVSPQAEYTLPIIYSRENRAKLVYLVEGSLAPNEARKLHSGAPVEVRLAKDK